MHRRRGLGGDARRRTEGEAIDDVQGKVLDRPSARRGDARPRQKFSSARGLGVLFSLGVRCAGSDTAVSEARASRGSHLTLSTSAESTPRSFC